MGSRSVEQATQLVRRLGGNDLLVMSTLALGVGAIASMGAVAFREGIDLVQWVMLGFRSELVASLAAEQPAWRILLMPALGGLIVGLLVRYIVPGRRPQGVADVIEASALRGGRVSARAGLTAAIVTITSIGSGASVGREGPAVHLGAALASFIGRPFHLSRAQARTLLGCGVASAVAASFNAPIAGAFFALEVVVGHYALPAFAPIVIASVTGTVISRIWFGSFPAFVIPPNEIQSFLEFPAFAILGVASAVVAIVFMRAIPMANQAFMALPLPRWSHPALAGLMIGAVALQMPEILGVGYEATDGALKEQYTAAMMLGLLVAKVAATAICLGAGFGGGVFSPSLFIGAMLGGTFGVLATLPFPELSSGHGAYTLIGMGAVSGAVLGAPISTILIIFELTGDYELTIGVMVAVVIASVITRQFHGVSYFMDQLERRGLRLQGGHEVALLGALKVHDLARDDQIVVKADAPIAEIRDKLRYAPMNELFVVDDTERLAGTVTLADLGDTAFDRSHDAELTALDVARRKAPFIETGDDLQRAMRLFAEVDEGILAVVDDAQNGRVVGCLHERDVMKAYNAALVRLRAEEHGER